MSAIKKLRRYPPVGNRLHKWRYKLRNPEAKTYPHLMSKKTLPAIGKTQGRLLLGLINMPFWKAEGSAPIAAHTNIWETLEMAKAWREKGFQVDVVNWRNLHYIPEHSYDVAIDARYNLARWDKGLGDDCIRISHLDFAHWLQNDTEQYRRLEAIKRRRGVTLTPRRAIGENRAIEDADCATILGTKWSTNTYAFANKPLYKIPLSTQIQYDWIDRDWDRAKKNFIWVGSVGAVHKGLDLLLEAFSKTPDLHLTIVGPVEQERDFVSAYSEELYNFDNIELRGFMDVTSDEYKDLVSQHGVLIFPSCSECGAGVVIGGLHAGLIPVVTEPAAIDSGTETIINEATPESVIEAIRQTAERDNEDLAATSRAGWEFVRANHTRENYAKVYRETVSTILDRGRHK